MAAFMTKLGDEIEERGFSTTAVFPTADSPGPWFAYTIGLRKTYDHPELIVYGLGQDEAGGILAGAVDLIQAGTRLEPGRRYAKILRDFDVETRAVGAPGYPLNMARRYYGEDVEAIQLVWPDAAGVFPLEPGFDPEFNGAQVFPDGTEADA